MANDRERKAGDGARTKLKPRGSPVAWSQSSQDAALRTAERLDAPGLLALQRTIGNAAVVSLLSRRTGSPEPTRTLARRSQAMVQRFTDDDVRTRAYYIWERKGKKALRGAECSTGKS
jgi:hypothetical protein